MTFGNGVPMSLRALEHSGLDGTVLDLRWLVPLPVEELLRQAEGHRRVLVVDETRRSGGVSEGIVTALVEGGYRGRIDRLASQDSIVPLGPAAAEVLLSEADIVAALQH